MSDLVLITSNNKSQLIIKNRKVFFYPAVSFCGSKFLLIKIRLAKAYEIDDKKRSITPYFLS